MESGLVEIEGGVTAPRGFRAGAVPCGLKGGDVMDLGLLVSDFPSVSAATFTTNRIKAAPVRVSSEHLRAADTRGVIINSGNANACTGSTGIQNAKRMARAVAIQLGVKDRQILVCSTGRIGCDLPIEKIEEAVPSLVRALTENGSGMIARAMMTSDTFQKEAAVEFSVGSHKVRVGGIAKGAGMINPNMATMLCVVATDARIAKRDLQKLFSASVEQSFNCITVDGDMSTNDTAICLANGQAVNELLRPDNEHFFRFDEALKSVTRKLAKMIVEDGEGTSKFVEVHVKGASTYQDARKVAEAVANSSLVKCSWHGEDPNWGRVMGAIGYSCAKVREEMIDIFFDGVIAAQTGVASSTPQQTLKEALGHKQFTLTIDLHMGAAEYKVYTTDLTPDYVRLNMSE